MEIRKILTTILEIIDYPENKEEFINKLTSSICLETLNQLLVSLPEEKQTQIKDQLKNIQTADAFEQIINSNFDQNLFQETVKITTQKIFTEYLQTIEDVLTEEQKIKLDNFFKTL
jgi:hypothetical protein